jgi:hypothetical protein
VADRASCRQLHWRLRTHYYSVHMWQSV